MPPQKRAASRGRRDPNLLSDQQLSEQAGQQDEDFDPEADGDELNDQIQLLFEGDIVRAGVSIPVTLGEMDRFSLVQAEATVHVRDGEGGIDTAERAIDAMRVTFFNTLDKMEDDLRAYAEQQAADAARVDRQVRTGR